VLGARSRRASGGLSNSNSLVVEDEVLRILSRSYGTSLDWLSLNGRLHTAWPYSPACGMEAGSGDVGTQ
jgi:hypothetical protein